MTFDIPLHHSAPSYDAAAFLRAHLHASQSSSDSTEAHHHLEDLVEQAAQYDAEAPSEPIEDPAPPQPLPPLVIVEVKKNQNTTPGCLRRAVLSSVHLHPFHWAVYSLLVHRLFFSAL
jgi:hypothetical protein